MQERGSKSKGFTPLPSGPWPGTGLQHSVTLGAAGAGSRPATSAGSRTGPLLGTQTPAPSHKASPQQSSTGFQKQDIPPSQQLLMYANGMGPGGQGGPSGEQRMKWVCVPRCPALPRPSLSPVPPLGRWAGALSSVPVSAWQGKGKVTCCEWSSGQGLGRHSLTPLPTPQGTHCGPRETGPWMAACSRSPAVAPGAEPLVREAE